MPHYQLLQCKEIFLPPHFTRGIIRIIDNDKLCPVAAQCRNRVPVHGKIRRKRAYRYDLSAKQRDHGRIQVIGRLKDDDFVSLLQERRHTAENSFGRAIGDQHFRIGIISGMILRRVHPGDLLPEWQYARHRRILVVALTMVKADLIQQDGINIIIRESLGQVNGLVLLRELGHHCKYGRAYLGQLGCNGMHSKKIKRMYKRMVISSNTGQ